MTQNQFIKNSGQALTAAGVGAAATMYLHPNATITLPGVNVDVPLWAFAAASCAAGSMISSVLHDSIFPLVDISERLSDPISSAVGAGISGASYAGIGTLAGAVPQLPATELVAVAAGAELAGSFLWHNVLSGFFNGDELIAA